MTKAQRLKAGKDATDSIVFDISDRRGLKGEWGMIDDNIKREI
jgi:hypothetical protein